MSNPSIHNMPSSPKASNCIRYRYHLCAGYVLSEEAEVVHDTQNRSWKLYLSCRIHSFAHTNQRLVEFCSFWQESAFQITKRLLLSLFLAMSATIKDFYSFSFERRKWRRIHSIQARHNRERRRMEWRNFLSWVGVEKCFWNRSHFRFKLKLQWHPARSSRRIFGSLDAKKMELPSLCFARIMHWE